jgi:hypothetical protein
VHYMCCICCDFPRLVYPFTTNWIRAGVLLVDRFVVGSTTVLGLEFFDAVRIPLQLTRNFCLMELPRISPAEPWMILLCVQIDNITKNGHQWEKEPKNIVSVKVSVCSQLNETARSYLRGALETQAFGPGPGVSSVELASLPECVWHRLKQIFTFVV